MIKYKLVCKKCDLNFDSWFASSKEFEKLKKKRLLNCHSCNSIEVDKSLMAPKISKTNNINIDKETQKLKSIRNKIKEYQNFIKNNFEYVGKNFTYEARSIHYSTNKKKKAIYGTASKKDLKELKEEGIEAQAVPWIEDKNN